MPRRPERLGELRLEHRFDGFPHRLTELRFEVLAELQNRRMVRALRATLLHSVPPSPLITAICLASREVKPFCFFYKSGQIRSTLGRVTAGKSERPLIRGHASVRAPVH